MSRRQFLFFVLLFVFAAQLAAQTTVRLRGRLTTAEDAPAPERSIFVAPTGCCVCSCREKSGDYYCCKDKAGLCCAGMSVTGKTSANGEFSIVLAPGKYDVFFDKVETSTRLASEVQVAVGQSATLDLRLPEPKQHRRMRKE
jgi:hypothetical protein